METANASMAKATAMAKMLIYFTSNFQ